MHTPRHFVSTRRHEQKDVLLQKIEPKNVCRFGAAQGDADECERQPSAGAKVFWFFFSKNNTSSLWLARARMVGCKGKPTFIATAHI